MVPDPLLPEIQNSSPLWQQESATFACLPVRQTPVCPSMRLTRHSRGQRRQSRRIASACSIFRSSSPESEVFR